MAKFLIVGTGFSGATLARCLAEKGHIIDIIDKRSHIAGNAYDYIEPSSCLRIHKYGPHIFHTNNKDVVEFLSRFTSWVPYKHKVKAIVNSKNQFKFKQYFLTMPPNKNTKKILNKIKLDMIETLYRPYSEKMWGLPLEKIDPSITDRVKSTDDDNEYYFPNDKYQFMPTNGYTELIRNMLVHENITISLNTPFDRKMEDNYDHVFNSMPIDEYYKEFFGPLEYRTIKFNAQIINKNDANYNSQKNPTDVAVLNNTTTANVNPETRKTYWSMFPNNIKSNYEVITFETPDACKTPDCEKLYPVKDIDGENRKRYEKYKSIPNDKVTFIGRLGNYVYIDMHQAVNASLQLSKKYPYS